MCKARLQSPENKKKKQNFLVLVVLAYNPNAWEAKPGGLQVEASGQFSKTMTPKKKKNFMQNF
jgi:hypothetical protein